MKKPKATFDFFSVFADFEYDICFSKMSWEFEVKLMRWGRQVFLDVADMGYEIDILAQNQDALEWLHEYVGIFDLPVKPNIVFGRHIPDCDVFVAGTEKRAAEFKELYPDRVACRQHSDADNIESYTLGYNDMMIAIKLMYRRRRDEK